MHNAWKQNNLTLKDKLVDQKRSRRRTRIQMAHAVMLPVSCQQDMKLYASWTHCSCTEVHLVPQLLYPIATAGNSLWHNSVGPYPDAVIELKVQSSDRTDFENKVSAASHLSGLWDQESRQWTDDGKCLFGINYFFRIYLCDWRLYFCCRVWIKTEKFKYTAFTFTVFWLQMSSLFKFYDA